MCVRVHACTKAILSHQRPARRLNLQSRESQTKNSSPAIIEPQENTQCMHELQETHRWDQEFHLCSTTYLTQCWIFVIKNIYFLYTLMFTGLQVVCIQYMQLKSIVTQGLVICVVTYWKVNCNGNFITQINNIHDSFAIAACAHRKFLTWLNLLSLKALITCSISAYTNLQPSSDENRWNGVAGMMAKYVNCILSDM